MSMDYKKNVYSPVRDHTRKITSYGQMNSWHDYKVPLSLGEHPRVPHLDNLGPGVEIRVPEPAEALMEPNELEKQKLRKLVVERNRREIAQASTSSNSGHLTQYLNRNKRNLSPVYSGQEPVVVGGRILRPDPMMKGSGAHLYYNKSGGYDDYHKTYLKLQKDGVYPSYPMYGPPRLHHGKMGGSWKHVKNVLQAGGQRRVFVDGTPRLIENSKLTCREVPGADILYPPARRSMNKALTDPYKIGMTDSYKEAIRQTEAGNWNLLR